MPDGDTEPSRTDPGAILFKVITPEHGRWIAEARIPWRMVDITPAVNRRVAFNLTVRDVLDDLWLMWEGTRGHSYDIEQSGFIEF